MPLYKIEDDGCFSSWVVAKTIAEAIAQWRAAIDSIPGITDDEKSDGDPSLSVEVVGSDDELIIQGRFVG
jgi:hypothetical protein